MVTRINTVCTKFKNNLFLKTYYVQFSPDEIIMGVIKTHNDNVKTAGLWALYIWGM